MTGSEQELNKLFAAYRKACPDPEASPDFMPAVWRRIESRRRFSVTLKRWTGAFVTASAAVCIAMSIYMNTRVIVTVPDDPSVMTTTYTESLDTEPLDLLAYSDIMPGN